MNRVTQACSALLAGLLALSGILGECAIAQNYRDTVSAIKSSVVAVGTYQRTRTPPFVFRGTGFAIGDGRRIATNVHVLPAALDTVNREMLAILVPIAENIAMAREVAPMARDGARDLAILALEGDPLPALRIADADVVREGDTYLITGFPLGNVLGPYPSTHRVMVAAIPPLVLPADQSSRLDAAAVRQLANGAFRVFQLDGTAMPGNSGSPMIDPVTRRVVGVVNSAIVTRTREAPNGAPVGIAFAIPADHLLRLLEGPVAESR